jgi:parallel beta-helix repeat protein
MKRWLAFSVMMTLALLFMSLLAAHNVSANHPVLVEGNCDSPVPGTTLVQPGTCGDFDGDGRIGTAEDTDGADRIFGTINAALGPGTGAAAGTGANFNGSVTIITSGRFAETITISPAPLGQVTLQAAPGVSADINAVLQGDPAGLNITRQGTVGMDINSTSTDSKIILRNLTIRNFATGIVLRGASRVTMDNCRLENNLDYGIRLIDTANLSGENLRIASTGFRVSSGPVNTTALGHGISFENSSAGTVYHSQITGSFGAAISNTSAGGAPAVRYYEVFLSHNGSGIVNATRDNTP